jgi:hypothetical protein
MKPSVTHVTTDPHSIRLFPSFAITVCAALTTTATQLTNTNKVDVRMLLLQSLKLLVEERIRHDHAENDASEHRSALAHQWGQSILEFLDEACECTN